MTITIYDFTHRLSRKTLPDRATDFEEEQKKNKRQDQSERGLTEPAPVYDYVYLTGGGMT